MVTGACYIYRYRINVITSALEVDDAGSIPVLRNFIVLFLTAFAALAVFRVE